MWAKNLGIGSSVIVHQTTAIIHMECKGVCLLVSIQFFLVLLWHKNLRAFELIEPFSPTVLGPIPSDGCSCSCSCSDYGLTGALSVALTAATHCVKYLIVKSTTKNKTKTNLGITGKLLAGYSGNTWGQLGTNWRLHWDFLGTTWGILNLVTTQSFQ